MARTQDPAVDRAIHQATLDLLSAGGLSGVTIDQVAIRAAVARTTVYRRYDSIPEMVVAAVNDLLAVEVTDSDRTGEEAWHEFVLSLRRALFESKQGLPLLAALILAEQEHPKLLTIWRERVVAQRLEMIQTLTGLSADRARRIGQLAIGGLIGGFLGSGAVSRKEALALADDLWAAFGPSRLNASD